MSPTDNQDDRDVALDRAQARHEAAEQAADDRCSEPLCDWCKGGPVVTNLDGDNLCNSCADQWCRNEGTADYERERTGSV